MNWLENNSKSSSEDSYQKFLSTKMILDDGFFADDIFKSRGQVEFNYLPNNSFSVNNDTFIQVPLPEISNSAHLEVINCPIIVKYKDTAFIVHQNAGIDISKISYFEGQESLINGFLKQNFEIYKLLNDCWKDLNNTFGKGVCIDLEYLKYSEEDRKYEKIIGWICSEEDILSGLEKLEKFCLRWKDRCVDLFHVFEFDIIVNDELQLDKLF